MRNKKNFLIKKIHESTVIPLAFIILNGFLLTQLLFKNLQSEKLFHYLDNGRNHEAHRYTQLEY